MSTFSSFDMARSLIKKVSLLFQSREKMSSNLHDSFGLGVLDRARVIASHTSFVVHNRSYELVYASLSFDLVVP